MLVSELARRDVTVALSADAGDELFGGYSKYKYVLNTFPKLNRIPISIRERVADVLSTIDPNSIPYFNKTYNFKTRFSKGISLLKSTNSKEAQLNISKYFSDHEISALLLNPGFSNHAKFTHTGIDEPYEDLISAMLCADFKTYMAEDILTKVDRATMRVGLEGREPLLDHRLAEWVAQLPNKYKISDKGQKILLKQITHSYIPKQIMDRPKMGFGIPLVEWFQSEIQAYMHEYLNQKFIENQGLFNFSAISQVVSDYKKNNSQNVFKLWNLLMFQMWYNQWMR
jgi:asparagine synthase (glutamine-hydrolysing)